MHDDDHAVKPLVIDISTTAASTDHIASEATDDVDPDAGQSTELHSTSVSTAVLPLVLPPAVDGSENLEEDDGGEYDELCDRHPASVSSDSQSTMGSAGKDLTGGDLSPTAGLTARCSKSRRKADRVSTIHSHFLYLPSNNFYRTNPSEVEWAN